MPSALLDRLGVAPRDHRAVLLAVLGAALVMAFFTLARALRETLFLTAFPVARLPLMVIATAVLTLPAVGYFAQRLSRGEPRATAIRLSVILAVGTLALGPMAPGARGALVAFYLLTAVGALLLASSFWLVVAELFPVREAKRVYGLVTAGGTAGTLVAGFSLGGLVHTLPLAAVGSLLAALLGAYALVIGRLPRGPAPMLREAGAGPSRFPVRDAVVEMAKTPHLCRIAALVLAATVASTLIDFQFKAHAQAAWPDPADLSGFLGVFYGWTGAAALLLQLVAAPRLLGERGVGGALSVLPAVLTLGGLLALIWPGMASATLLRGADNTLRRALHRPVMEYLYVPLPAPVRRRTKTVVDTLADTLGEALGSVAILIWLAVAALSWRSLSLLVVLLGALLALLGRRMAEAYARSIVARLREAAGAHTVAPAARDLFTASFTRMDLSFALADRVALDGSPSPMPALPPSPPLPPSSPTTRPVAAPPSTLTRLQSPDNDQAAAALADLDPHDAAHLEATVRLLARDAVRRQAAAALAAAPDAAVPAIIAALRDRATAFAVRRRLPALLAASGGPDADDALIDSLTADRFEVRYRAAVALGLRRRDGLPASSRDWRGLVWQALAAEVARERPVWELHRLLDGRAEIAGDWLAQHVDVRGGLGLEHTFRLLSLVLDRAAVGAAYQGIVAGDPHLRSYALEYLEQVLPTDLRQRLWTVIGDVSERQRDREQRPLGVVLDDLMNSQATLFADERQQREVRRLLDDDRRQ